eukprot:4653890-Pleurochrysis_carterae.AAC.1
MHETARRSKRSTSHHGARVDHAAVRAVAALALGADLRRDESGRCAACESEIAAPPCPRART